MNTYINYQELVKPLWSPPAWLFAPVWTVLYIIIAISFGYVILLYFKKQIPFWALLPFILNLAFNFAFTPLQFGLKNLTLAWLDILAVLGTLVWLMFAIFPYARWVAFVNIPYLLWVAFATILQSTITYLNRK